MLVASLDPVKKKISVFSILRDTYVPIPDHGEKRINTAIIYGPNTAMQTVSDLLGIPIQYYVYTDFKDSSSWLMPLGVWIMKSKKIWSTKPLQTVRNMILI